MLASVTVEGGGSGLLLDFSLPLNLRSFKENKYFKRETKEHFSNLLCNEC